MEIPIKSRPSSKISLWAKAHKKEIFISVGVFILLASITTAVLVLTKKPDNDKANNTNNVVKEEPKPEPEPIKYYSPLTGVAYEDELLTKRPVTGVMIENSPEARPQSGLKEAGVVFEAIAEAGITRFLAIYQSERPEIIGPVRSVRLYYAHWIAAFDASIAHAGGSTDGLAEVRNGSYRDIDQFSNGDYYWRSTDRYAPHNLYTSFEKLDELNLKKGYTSSDFSAFPRTDNKPTDDAKDATNINVSISSAMFNSSYSYDETTNTYLRSQAGMPHLDREKGQIAPSVVIAIEVDETTLSDGHEKITTIGSGNATIFQNGTAISAIWTKDEKTSQIKFTDIINEEIPLVRGQTWIVAIPNGRGDVVWN